MTEKKVYELTVDSEFRDLIPPLNEEELKLLEESIVADGCESPLIVWNGVIVDGHNRYAICRKNEIPFAIQEKDFSSRDDAMLWMLRNQLGRRNLNSYQRVELVLKFEPLVKNAAEQRMMAGKAANPVPTLAQGQTKGRTRDHLSEAAGVSHGTFAKAKKLVQSADEETKRELRAGKVTVNRACTELLEKEHEGETKICERCKQEKPLSAFSIPSNRRSFSSVCRDCEKEISAVAKSAAEAAAKPADIAASSEPPCPIPGMVMHNGAPIHVERPLPDTPEMFYYVADLVKSCCDSYVIGLTSAMRRYSSGMGSETQRPDSGDGAPHQCTGTDDSEQTNGGEMIMSRKNKNGKRRNYTSKTYGRDFLTPTPIERAIQEANKPASPQAVAVSDRIACDDKCSYEYKRMPAA